jgi:hypothetical protein
MSSRQGRIALQLTQWVGGTIIVLMFMFILADYVLQAGYYSSYQEDLAARGADGLKKFVDSRLFEDAERDLGVSESVLEYTENIEQRFALFDVTGKLLAKSPGVLSNDQSEMSQLSRPPYGGVIEVRRLKLSGAPITAAIVPFESKGEPGVSGVAAYIIATGQQHQIGLELWGLRSLMVLVMIVGTMLAVRIPVRRFVVAPIDGLFMAAYAASRDNFQRLPDCPVDNEFADLYEMFNRLMGHLSDTRTSEAAAEKTGEGETGEAKAAPEDAAE